MPHFTMEYLANLEKSVDFPALCKVAQGAPSGYATKTRSPPREALAA
jgi:hypothetical protein